jgi:SAM-dependent methyltransferase
VNRTESEEAQRRHYERLAAEYDEGHYDDPWSRHYRRRFIDGPLLDGLDLKAREVLEAMCGGGHVTGTLLERGARVTGLDISEAAIRSFRRRWPDCRAVCTSILDSGLPRESFDAAVVVAGLHHLHPHVPQAIEEVHRLLRPGGTFCFMEPHAGSLPDWFRRRWYRIDPLFLDNEAAIDLEALKGRFASRFEVVSERYGGNLAFLLVQNSLVFRIPLGAKRLYAPLLLPLEALLGKLQGRTLSCFAICRWRKKGGASRQ